MTQPPIAFCALALLTLAACADNGRKPPPPAVAPQSAASLLLRVDCADWKRNSDGSWTTRRPTPVDGPGSLVISQTNVLNDIVVIRGRDLALDLDQTCAAR